MLVIESLIVFKCVPSKLELNWGPCCVLLGSLRYSVFLSIPGLVESPEGRGIPNPRVEGSSKEEFEAEEMISF